MLLANLSFSMLLDAALSLEALSELSKERRSGTQSGVPRQQPEQLDW